MRGHGSGGDGGGVEGEEGGMNSLIDQSKIK